MHVSIEFKRIVLMGAVLLALAACGKSDDKAKSADKSASEPAAMAVTITQPQLQTMAQSIVASGSIVPFEDMQLGVELNGLRIRDVHVDVGQAVRKGQVLLTLDARGVQSGLQQAEAVLREAEAGVLLAKTNLNRGKELLTRKLISQSEFEQLTATHVQATAREATAHASRDAARLQVEYATLRAPDDGVISKRNAQPGMVVMAGAELLRLIRQNRLEWRADLSERELLQVKTGMSVRLKDTNGAEAIGRLRAASPGVDAATRTGTVMFDVPDPKGLRIGSFAEGVIELGSQNAVVLPDAAVVRRDGYAYVFAYDANSKTVKRLRVQLGRQAGGMIEIKDGVRETQSVVTSGAGFLSDGDKVRVVTTP